MNDFMIQKVSFLIFIVLYSGCENSNKQMNELSKETSPYLLQHANNPIHWKAWNPETLELAKKENKLILISIGYASCHWCHVMEKESFEDEEVAAFMNENFINIKVDREERPDVDMLYMNAVQLMTRSGGWPLNVLALPNGKPFWGGTYFPKENWMKNLSQLVDLYKESPEKIEDYATKVENGLKGFDTLISIEGNSRFSNKKLELVMDSLSQSLDYNKGGFRSRTKFMMPNNLQFIMRYAYQKKDKKLKSFIDLTLKEMAYGGVYDHIGGGFSRYTVDQKWHIPHFEKMLYDNAQLVSLYSNAYKLDKNELYKQVVEETLSFVERELMTEDNVFYSSLDADSKNSVGNLEEGAYYVWTKEELKSIIDKEDWKWFESYFNVNNTGFWEHDNYVLIRTKSNQEIAKEFNLSETDLNSKLNQIKKVLFKEREKRNRPRLDDKSITSWNALMLQGYVDAYKAFRDQHYLDIALKNAEFLKNQIQKDGEIFHSYKNGKSSINGYLEDYATVIQAFISLYELTSDENWLTLSKQLADYSNANFYDDNSGLFFFTSVKENQLFTRNIEKYDNVIPASNSIMAKNLFKLYHYLGEREYLNTCESMLKNMSAEFEQYGENYTNWLDLMLNFTEPYYEIAIAGNNAKQMSSEFYADYIPNALFAFTTKESNAYLLENRYSEDETLIYVCQNNTCKLPVEMIEEAKSLMNNSN